MAAKKQLPSTYEQQQQIRQQRQRMMTNKAKEQMVYAEGSGNAAAQSAVKQRSQAVDYSKARSGSYNGPSLSTLNGLLTSAQESGDVERIKRIKDQIAQAKKAGAK